MTNNYVIRDAKYLVTVDETDQILQGATIVIIDGLISAINPATIPTDRYYEEFNAEGHLIMPGLINTHTHLAMTLLRGWAEGVNLDGVLERVWAAEGAIMDKATSALGTELGASEALLSGTTSTLDMYLNPDATHAAAVRVGLRHVAGPIFFDFPGLDGLDWKVALSLLANGQILRRKLVVHRPRSTLCHIAFIPTQLSTCVKSLS